MSSERPEEISPPKATETPASSEAPKPTDAGQRTDDTRSRGAPGQTSSGTEPRPVTVMVRGETVADPVLKSPPKEQSASQNESPAPAKGASTNGGGNTSQKKVSDAKVKMQARLPALDDDRDVGVQKEQVVVRDGKADLAFTGTLLASAAPSSAPSGHWEEYRVYETSAGKHVFSKVTRNVAAEEQDQHEAEVFDPSPSSMPSQLLRSARELTRSRPLTWRDTAVDFFGYDPLAKALYRKLGDQFEEHVG